MLIGGSPPGAAPFCAHVGFRLAEFLRFPVPFIAAGIPKAGAGPLEKPVADVLDRRQGTAPVGQGAGKGRELRQLPSFSRTAAG